MTLIPNILAAGEGPEDLFKLILVLGAAGVIAVVRWLGKKASEKQAEQQAAEQARRLQEDLEADKARPDQRSTAQMFQDPRQAHQTPYRPIAAQPGATPHVPRQAPQRRRRKPPAQPAEPVVLEPAPEHRLVEAEVAMPSAVHHDFYAYPGRPGALSHEAAQAARAVTVDLSNPDTLRQAVIYHELLSPPKALRHESEPWEV
jgi:hypothetical protein